MIISENNGSHITAVNMNHTYDMMARQSNLWPLYFGNIEIVAIL